MLQDIAPVAHEVRQEEGIDLVCEMKGVVATWKGVDGREPKRVVLPHYEMDASRQWTRGSAEHEDFWVNLQQPGKLILESRVDVTHLMQPRVQVGAALDYTPDWEEGVIQVRTIGKGVKPIVRADGIEVPVDPVEPGAISIPVAKGATEMQLEIETVTSPGVDASVAVSFTTRRDGTARSLASQRFTPTFLSRDKKDRGVELAAVEQKWDEKIPAGAWLRGRELYYGAGLCSRCHTLRGMPGGVLGPDLSNLAYRDDTSILRDIRQPNAALNPDHLMVLVRLQSGEVVSGVPLAHDNEASILVGLVDGTQREIKRIEIEEIKPATVSLMPSGLVDNFSEEQLNDLLLFLKRNPLEPTMVVREDQPPYRSWTEFQQLEMAADAFKGTKLTKPLHVVLCDGPKDHGPDEHDYPEWKRRWLRLLGLVPEIKVEEASQWPSSRQLESADLIVFFSANPQWKGERGEELDRYLARGGGLVFMHFAVNGQQAVEPLAVRIGLACDPKILKYRHGPVSLRLAKEHPLTLGLPTLDLVDESYWKMTGDPGSIQVVASGEEENAQQPLIWTVERGKGRVFVTIMGHYSWTLDDPLYRILLLRGMMWAGHQPPDALLPLSTVGARIR
jgi:putative heme-binding domain-containing protein